MDVVLTKTSPSSPPPPLSPPLAPCVLSCLPVSVAAQATCAGRDPGERCSVEETDLTGQQASTFLKTSNGACGIPLTSAECQQHATDTGVGFSLVTSTSTKPPGCFLNNGGNARFNAHPTGASACVGGVSTACVCAYRFVCTCPATPSLPPPAHPSPEISPPLLPPRPSPPPPPPVGTIAQSELFSCHPEGQDAIPVAKDGVNENSSGMTLVNDNYFWRPDLGGELTSANGKFLYGNVVGVAGAKFTYCVDPAPGTPHTYNDCLDQCTFMNNDHHLAAEQQHYSTLERCDGISIYLQDSALDAASAVSPADQPLQRQNQIDCYCFQGVDVNQGMMQQPVTLAQGGLGIFAREHWIAYQAFCDAPPPSPPTLPPYAPVACAEFSAAGLHERIENRDDPLNTVGDKECNFWSNYGAEVCERHYKALGPANALGSKGWKPCVYDETATFKCSNSATVACPPPSAPPPSPEAPPPLLPPPPPPLVPNVCGSMAGRFHLRDLSDSSYHFCTGVTNTQTAPFGGCDNVYSLNPSTYRLNLCTVGPDGEACVSMGGIDCAPPSAPPPTHPPPSLPPPPADPPPPPLPSGWFWGQIGESCSDACARYGLVCNEAYVHANFMPDQDSTPELEAVMLLADANSYTIDPSTGAHVPLAPYGGAQCVSTGGGSGGNRPYISVPPEGSNSALKCYHSRDDGGGSYGHQCGTTQESDPYAQRLCFCHGPVDPTPASAEPAAAAGLREPARARPAPAERVRPAGRGGRLRAGRLSQVVHGRGRRDDAARRLRLRRLLHLLLGQPVLALLRGQHGPLQDAPPGRLLGSVHAAVRAALAGGAALRAARPAAPLRAARALPRPPLPARAERLRRDGEPLPPARPLRLEPPLLHRRDQHVHRALRRMQRRLLAQPDHVPAQPVHRRRQRRGLRLDGRDRLRASVRAAAGRPAAPSAHSGRGRLLLVQRDRRDLRRGVRAYGLECEVRYVRENFMPTQDGEAEVMAAMQEANDNSYLSVPPPWPGVCDKFIANVFSVYPFYRPAPPAQTRECGYSIQNANSNYGHGCDAGRYPGAHRLCYCHETLSPPSRPPPLPPTAPPTFPPLVPAPAPVSDTDDGICNAADPFAAADEYVMPDGSGCRQDGANVRWCTRVMRSAGNFNWVETLKYPRCSTQAAITFLGGAHDCIAGSIDTESCNLYCAAGFNCCPSLGGACIPSGRGTAPAPPAPPAPAARRRPDLLRVPARHGRLPRDPGREEILLRGLPSRLPSGRSRVFSDRPGHVGQVRRDRAPVRGAVPRLRPQARLRVFRMDGPGLRRLPRLRAQGLLGEQAGEGHLLRLLRRGVQGQGLPVFAERPHLRLPRRVLPARAFRPGLAARAHHRRGDADANLLQDRSARRRHLGRRHRRLHSALRGLHDRGLVPVRRRRGERPRRLPRHGRLQRPPVHDGPPADDRAGDGRAVQGLLVPELL